MIHVKVGDLEVGVVFDENDEIYIQDSIGERIHITKEELPKLAVLLSNMSTGSLVNGLMGRGE